MCPRTLMTRKKKTQISYTGESEYKRLFAIRNSLHKKKKIVQR